ncbi:MAG: hypothetical protein U9Q71_01350, partial [Pseudomonadota bacterium]|nr:hypothetical protein [Pseudomonadota bacterium]
DRFGGHIAAPNWLSSGNGPPGRSGQAQISQMDRLRIKIPNEHTHLFARNPGKTAGIGARRIDCVDWTAFGVLAILRPCSTAKRESRKKWLLMSAKFVE